MAKRRRQRQAPAPPVLHHRVYVVRLSNPLGDGRDGYYVGMTGLTPEERFDNHKRGYRSAKVVTRCGVALAPEWYEDIPPMTFEDAALCEPALADELRDLGHVVFGPTNRMTPPRRAQKKR
jgi:hypothetical protein